MLAIPLRFVVSYRPDPEVWLQWERHSTNWDNDPDSERRFLLLNLPLSIENIFPFLAPGSRS
jgi:hypothetical protein